MNDLTVRMRELSPAGKRALLAGLLKMQQSRGKTAPLSHAQQRLWFLEQLVPGNPSYNESSAVRLRYPLNSVAFEKSIAEIIRRHESLRTVFEAPNGEPLQRVLPALDFKLQIVDLGNLPEAQREMEAAAIANEQASQPFNLAKGPLLRAALLRLAQDEHVFVLTMHHIVCDGWSMNVFFEELAVLYQSFIEGRPTPLPDLSIQYTDFAIWQRQWLQGPLLEEQLEFWRNRLADLQNLELPTDKPRPSIPTFTGGREAVNLTPQVTRALQALCEQASVTPFMALLAAFQILLQRYTGQDDIAVGSPVAGRNRPELEKLIGFFVNTVVMRTDLSGQPTFREVLRRVREVALSAYAHQDLPFERLVEELQPRRDPSRNPLFQVTFQLLSDTDKGATGDELPVLNMDVDLPTSKFDLRCDLWHRGDVLCGYIEYSADLFEAETARAMTRHFETLVAALVAAPERRVAEVPMLSPAEERKLLVDWNNTARSFEHSGGVHERLENFAASHPNAIAVAESASSATYGEVNSRANQLARYLNKRGIGAGTLVAVLFDRSINLVVSTLAVLKAGAAYVPLDPSYPGERLSLMLRDAQVPLVLTDGKYEGRIPDFVPQFQLDRDWKACSGENDANLSLHIDERSLAYVIFTSGSTGKPRGVEITHSSLHNLIDWHQQEYSVTPTDRAMLYASPGFDASVWETWPYLTAGASLHIPDAETHVSPSTLARWMAAAGITICFLPTPIAECFVDLELPESLALRALLTGGDKLRRYPSRSLPFRFVNHYGPTENTVVATAFDVAHGAAQDAPPIGRPIANVQAYVLDRHGRLVPPGAKGELYLGGAGLARGYLNAEHQTQERFIQNPLDRRPGSRLYRTGDLVRYRRDGNLEFHGRADSQIKLRGFRIEPGEIETALDQHPFVQKSLVLARENAMGEKSLTAYLKPAPITVPAQPLAGAGALFGQLSQQDTAQTLRHYLRQRLPEYMVPSAFVMMEALPLTTHGKLDTRSLPAPDHPRADDGAEPAPPSNEIEAKLAGIWQEVLGLGRVDVHDNFFDIGGHSMLLVQVHNRLTQVFGSSLSIIDLFRLPSISALAHAIAERNGLDIPHIQTANP